VERVVGCRRFERLRLLHERERHQASKRTSAEAVQRRAPPSILHSQRQDY
jgi:hypothetical protein